MKKQVFYLRSDQPDPYLIKTFRRRENYNPSEPLIIWSIRLGGKILIMPELTTLVQEFYFFN